jgi:hypothetical protein
VGGPTLPLPAEPVTLRNKTRTLLEQSPEAGQQLLAAGEWIAAPLWKRWRSELVPYGMKRARFLEIVVDYRNELRLWVMGERPWEHCVAGLAGRVARRVAVTANDPRPGANGSAPLRRTRGTSDAVSPGSNR